MEQGGNMIINSRLIPILDPRSYELTGKKY
mgnify:CR=1 FL=1